MLATIPNAQRGEGVEGYSEGPMVEVTQGGPGEGCAWEGFLKDLPAHLSECSHKSGECPFAGIGCMRKGKMAAAAMKKHQSEAVSSHVELLRKHVALAKGASEGGQKWKGQCELLWEAHMSERQN